MYEHSMFEIGIECEGANEAWTEKFRLNLLIYEGADHSGRAV
jgi:hypothetical protein